MLSKIKPTIVHFSCLVGTSVVLYSSCSAPDPKEVKSSSVSASSFVECEKASPLAESKALTEFSSDEGDDYFLQTTTTPGYNDSIKSLVNGSCATAGCHVAGSTSPDLSTYALAKANMARSKIRIESASNPMPPGSQLSAGDRTLFANWVAANGPENDGGTSETPVATETPTPTPDTTPSATPTTEPSTACLVKNEKRVEVVDPDFDYLLRSADVSDCHSKKLIYDRNAKACGKASLTLDWCNRIGILKKFAEANKDVLTIVNKALGDGTNATDIGDGYGIDQCGMEASGAPIVIFMRLVKPPEVPGLKVRVLAIDDTKNDKPASAADTSAE